jgi:hypothetical protein
MRIAHNMCVDHFRKVKRGPSIKTSENHDIFEVLNFSEAGTDVKIKIVAIAGVSKIKMYFRCSLFKPLTATDNPQIPLEKTNENIGRGQYPRPMFLT